MWLASEETVAYQVERQIEVLHVHEATSFKIDLEDNMDLEAASPGADGEFYYLVIGVINSESFPSATLFRASIADGSTIS